MKSLLPGKHALLALAAAGIVLGVAAPAVACSCAGLPEASSAASTADVVFEGTALGEPEAVRAQLGIPGYDGAVRFRFQVARYFKGQLGNEAAVYTVDQESACGRSFSAGSSYVVYGRWQGDSLLTDNLCSRTRLLSAASEDLQLLGEGMAPDPSILPRDVLVEDETAEADVGCGVGASRATSALSALSSALLLAFALLRRRSARG
jgi:Tissue inhibitor of metalloproteinase